MRVLSRCFHPPAIAAAALPLLLLSSLLLGGCATKPTDPDDLAEYEQTNDPLEPTNRVFYAINNGIDTVVLRPLALAYRWALPETVRTHTHNVLANLSGPVTLSDDILSAKPRRAGDSFMRFVINSTVGVAGVFDVATGWGYPAHDADGGITLAVWGVPDGPFLFLPVLGPSSPRDATGFGTDIALDPFTWVGNGPTVGALGYARYGLSAVDTRAGLLDDLDKIKAQALDPYATLRSLYRQHRQSQIEDAQRDEPATVPAWYPQPAKPASLSSQ